jgi:hypothetical protein
MKFRIVCIDDLLASRGGDVCFGLIGHGPTFCIRKGCKTNHTGSKINIRNNSLCVVKIHDIALFCEPIIERDRVEH